MANSLLTHDSRSGTFSEQCPYCGHWYAPGAGIGRHLVLCPDGDPEERRRRVTQPSVDADEEMARRLEDAAATLREVAAVLRSRRS